jgi:anaerobic glycerol-3-phosphate dehydrogenase
MVLGTDSLEMIPGGVFSKSIQAESDQVRNMIFKMKVLDFSKKSDLIDHIQY